MTPRSTARSRSQTTKLPHLFLLTNYLPPSLPTYLPEQEDNKICIITEKVDIHYTSHNTHTTHLNTHHTERITHNTSHNIHTTHLNTLHTLHITYYTHHTPEHASHITHHTLHSPHTQVRTHTLSSLARCSNRGLTLSAGVFRIFGCFFAMAAAEAEFTCVCQETGVCI